MPIRPRPPASPLVCQRSFEPGHKQFHVLHDAYEQLLRCPCPARAAKDRPATRSGDKRREGRSDSVPSCGGICA